ncbi:helix-turn-helix domain-containing protein [Candidatus Comchoanobacter bicostacola]|uniref:Helix-turn-helix domain-containing protein n=1 Tax=Candidatus Comchoanobacter bicostacola TaxID=2919598 RepID=A0ABY5DK71_9GAMM|nr:helix-turn-helix transcriptional regulator [Candidatus Comchoanobacter bicostacola]UTC24888.1 helix-turn-helix domain-containing protein [Candidatus Comchoanobacter bicostacola]
MNQRIIGKDLADARQKRDLSIEQVSQLIKIKISQLTEIELDQYPSNHLDIYQIGYIQSYCRMLNMDSQLILNKLEAKGYTLSKPKSPIKKTNTRNNFRIIGYLILAFILLSSIINRSSTPQKSPEDTIAKPFNQI